MKRFVFFIIVMFVATALAGCTQDGAVASLKDFLSTPTGIELSRYIVVGAALALYSYASNKWKRILSWVYEFMNLAERHGKSNERWIYFWKLFKERYKAEYGRYPGVGLEKKVLNTVSMLSAARNLNLTSRPSVGG